MSGPSKLGKIIRRITLEDRHQVGKPAMSSQEFCNGLVLWPCFLFVWNIDGIACLRMVSDFVFPQPANHFKHQYREERFGDFCLAQPGAAVRRLLGVRNRLDETFGENHVARSRHNAVCIATSLARPCESCDYFMRGNLKDKIFSRSPENTQELLKILPSLRIVWESVKHQPSNLRMKYNNVRHKKRKGEKEL